MLLRYSHRWFVGEEYAMAKWRKSTRSAGQNACVELRSTAEGFQIRDSKLDERSPVFDLAGSDLAGLLRMTKS